MNKETTNPYVHDCEVSFWHDIRCQKINGRFMHLVQDTLGKKVEIPVTYCPICGYRDSND